MKQAVLNECQVFFASERDFKHFESDLTGEYQKHNQKSVLQTIEVLQASGRFLISDTHISNGLKKVVQNTGLQGRWQILNLKPKIICDTGHNAEGLQQVINRKSTFFWINGKKISICIFSIR